MKTTRLKFVRFIFLAALLMGVRAPLAAADGGHANVRAILVLASNQKSASDERLMADFCTELCFDEEPGFAMLMPSHGVVKVLQR